MLGKESRLQQICLADLSSGQDSIRSPTREVEFMQRCRLTGTYTLAKNDVSNYRETDEDKDMCGIVTSHKRRDKESKTVYSHIKMMLKETQQLVILTAILT